MMYIIILVAGAYIWRRTRSGRLQRHTQDIRDVLPDCIDLFMATLRAGYSPIQGLRFLGMHAPAKVRPFFIAHARRVDEGERFIDSLRQLQLEVGDVIRPLCDVLSAGDRLGIPVENLLFQLGNDARLSRRRAAETTARQLPIKLSLPLVICTLPSFIVLIIVPTIAGTLSQLQLTV